MIFAQVAFASEFDSSDVSNRPTIDAARVEANAPVFLINAQGRAFCEAKFIGKDLVLTAKTCVTDRTGTLIDFQKEKITLSSLNFKALVVDAQWPELIKKNIAVLKLERQNPLALETFSEQLSLNDLVETKEVYRTNQSSRAFEMAIFSIDEMNFRMVPVERGATKSGRGTAESENRTAQKATCVQVMMGSPFYMRSQNGQGLHWAGVFSGNPKESCGAPSLGESFIDILPWIESFSATENILPEEDLKSLRDLNDIEQIDDQHAIEVEHTIEVDRTIENKRTNEIKQKEQNKIESILGRT